MPYSGPGDDTLPAGIKRLSAIKRRAFVHAYNSAYADHRDGESAKEREGRAFATAHAAANRAGEKSMPEDIAVKDYDEIQEIIPVRVVEEYENPYRHMYSFSDLDTQHATEKATSALDMVFTNFKLLSENILCDDDLSADQKASALAALTGELTQRLADVRVDPEAAYRDIESAVTNTADDPGVFAAFKDAGGGWRWATVHTNKFRDKTGEILADEAHREYVDWANADKSRMPVLRFWHIPQGVAPGSPFDLGQADLVAYDDNGFVIASGSFFQDKIDVAERLAGMKDLGCSHGYMYKRSDMQNGVLRAYRTFEVTVVPRPYEANELTLAGVEGGIMLTGKQREAAIEVLGEERVKTLEEQMAGMRAVAEAGGISYKDVAEALVAPVEAEAITATAEVDIVMPESEPEEGSEPVPLADAMQIPQAVSAPADLRTEPDATATLIAAMQSAVEGALGPIRAELDELRQGQKDYLDRLAAVEQSDDERIAARIAPRVGPLVGAKAASRSPETAIPEDVAEQIRERFRLAEKVDGEPELTGAAAYMPGILQTLQTAALLGGD